MRTLAPYRTAAIDVCETKDRTERARRLWQRYQRACVQHNLMLLATAIGLVALMIASPIHVYALLGGFPLLFWFTWLRVRMCVCPFCGRRLIDGPKHESYGPMLLGAFPEACTHCGTAQGEVKPRRPPRL
jgi:hypothetical protein